MPSVPLLVSPPNSSRFRPAFTIVGPLSVTSVSVTWPSKTVSPPGSVSIVPPVTLVDASRRLPPSAVRSPEPVWVMVHVLMSSRPMFIAARRPEFAITELFSASVWDGSLAPTVPALVMSATIRPKPSIV